MKTGRVAVLVLAAFIVSLFSAAACAKTEKPKEKPKPSTISNYTGPKKRLGIMDMEVKVMATSAIAPTTSGGVVQTTTISMPPPSDFGTGLTEMLTTALIDTGRFVCLERKAITDIQSEQMLTDSGLVDPTSAAPKGSLLGAQVLIRGAVTEYSYNSSSTGGSASFLSGIGIASSKSEAMVVLDVRIYDVATGVILDSVKADGKAKSSGVALEIDKEGWQMSGSQFKQSPLGEATREAIEKAVKFICERMEIVPWEGRIAELDGDTMYLNAGSQIGLKVGDTLQIIRPGQPIVDPETRVVIGRKKDTILGKCRITEIMEKLSIAEPVEGCSWEVNDIVRFEETKTGEK